MARTTFKSLECIERWIRVDEKGCYRWLGAKNPKGYGHVRCDGVMTDAHRVAYELAFGSIPDGFEIHHECRVRDCVNPNHLKAVSHNEHWVLLRQSRRKSSIYP